MYVWKAFRTILARVNTFVITLVILKKQKQNSYKLGKEVDIHKGHLQRPAANIVIDVEMLKSFSLKSEARQNAYSHHV